ncbi:uncharacterized protein METZ01_LOCUS131908, partial [marine metagenome]
PSPFQVAADLATPTQVFRQQVEWIARTFDVIDPSILAGSESLPSHAAAITFDDAWLGTFTNGFAILDELGLPAISFLNYCDIDNGVDAAALAAFEHGIDSEFPSMKNRNDRPSDPDAFRVFQGDLATDSTIQYWNKHHRCSFGSHLYWHVLSTGATPAEFEESYLRNKYRLAELENGLDLMSFPFGQPGEHFDDSHVAAAQRLGAKRVFSARSRVNRGTLNFVIDRTSLSTQDSSPGTTLQYLHHRELRERLIRSSGPPNPETPH